MTIFRKFPSSAKKIQKFFHNIAYLENVPLNKIKTLIFPYQLILGELCIEYPLLIVSDQ
jgi:hypothetical protein